MTDIFAEWKKRRFVVVNEDFINERRSPTEDFLFGTTDAIKHLVVMTDIKFWNEHADELEQWAIDNGCKSMGMTVEINSDQTLTAFMLKWS